MVAFPKVKQSPLCIIGWKYYLSLHPPWSKIATYLPNGNESNLTFICCINAPVVKRLMKYLISQLLIHGIKLYIAQQPTHTHKYTNTHMHTLLTHCDLPSIEETQ